MLVGTEKTPSETEGTGAVDRLPESWFAPGVMRGTLHEVLPLAQDKVRVATAFFTPSGWNIIRREIPDGVQVCLLVGNQERDVAAVSETVNQIFLKELRRGLDVNRRRAVVDLLDRLTDGTIRILDARAADHHAKLYIADRTAAIVTSANVSFNGFLHRTESGTVERRGPEVEKLVTDFDQVLAGAQNIAPDFLHSLKVWLSVASPWQVYLKTLSALEELTTVPDSPYSKEPLNYQARVVARVMSQLREFGGSMLVASTGLGKSVIGTLVAIQAKNERLADNILIIAPRAVDETWSEEFRDAAMQMDFVTANALSTRADNYAAKTLEKVAEFLEHTPLDKRPRSLLIIIDECHIFRNKYQSDDVLFKKRDPRVQRAYERVCSLVRESNGKVSVFEMTGSPLGKEIGEVNNQLELLPVPEGRKEPWRIESPEQFTDCPVTNSITLAHVAAHFAVDAPEHPGHKYVMVKDRAGVDCRMYIPRIRLQSMFYPLPCQEELIGVINSGMLDIDAKDAVIRKSIRTLVQVAWASSPVALLDCLEKIATDKYASDGEKFIRSTEDRRQALDPIIETLRKQKPEDDVKLQALAAYLRENLKIRGGGQRPKFIVVCERHATAAYVCEELPKLFAHGGYLRAETTVLGRDGGLKEDKTIKALVRDFAPIANGRSGKGAERSKWDVLVVTDASAIGLNMQDASHQINYDGAWTAIQPIQRAGRILRFWHQPRMVSITSMIPVLAGPDEVSEEMRATTRRYATLMGREEHSRNLTVVPIFTRGGQMEVDFETLISTPLKAPAKVVHLDDADLSTFASSDPVSPSYQHAAVLHANMPEAKSLGSDLMSAKLMDGNEHKLYLLLKHRGNYYPCIFNISTGRLTEIRADEALATIKCDAVEKAAPLNPDLIEAVADHAIRTFCTRRTIRPNRVERECVEYLLPSNPDEPLSAALERIGIF